jgi:hypothetical protein
MLFRLSSVSYQTDLSIDECVVACSNFAQLFSKSEWRAHYSRRSWGMAMYHTRSRQLRIALAWDNLTHYFYHEDRHCDFTEQDGKITATCYHTLFSHPLLRSLFFVLAAVAVALAALIALTGGFDAQGGINQEADTMIKIFATGVGVALIPFGIYWLVRFFQARKYLLAFLENDLQGRKVGGSPVAIGRLPGDTPFTLPLPLEKDYKSQKPGELLETRQAILYKLRTEDIRRWIMRMTAVAVCFFLVFFERLDPSNLLDPYNPWYIYWIEFAILALGAQFFIARSRAYKDRLANLGLVNELRSAKGAGPASFKTGNRQKSSNSGLAKERRRMIVSTILSLAISVAVILPIYALVDFLRPGTYREHVVATYELQGEARFTVDSRFRGPIVYYTRYSNHEYGKDRFDFSFIDARTGEQFYHNIFEVTDVQYLLNPWAVYKVGELDGGAIYQAFSLMFYLRGDGSYMMFDPAVLHGDVAPSPEERELYLAAMDYALDVNYFYGVRYFAEFYEREAPDTSNYLARLQVYLDDAYSLDYYEPELLVPVAIEQGDYPAANGSRPYDYTQERNLSNARTFAISRLYDLGLYELPS